MNVTIKEQYILYAYNISKNKYVACRKFKKLNDLRKFYERVTRDDAKHKDLKYIPPYTVLNDYYIKHNVYEVTKILISEEIIMKDREE